MCMFYVYVLFVCLFNCLGVYIFNKSCISMIPLARCSLEKDFFPRLAARGTLYCWRLEGYWFVSCLLLLFISLVLFICLSPVSFYYLFYLFTCLFYLSVCLLSPFIILSVCFINLFCCLFVSCLLLLFFLFVLQFICLFYCLFVCFVCLSPVSFLICFVCLSPISFYYSF